MEEECSLRQYMGSVTTRDFQRMSPTGHIAWRKGHDVLACQLIGDGANRVGVILLRAPISRPTGVRGNALHVGPPGVVRPVSLPLYSFIAGGVGLSTCIALMQRNIVLSDVVVGYAVKPRVFKTDDEDGNVHLLRRANHAV